MWMFPNKKDFFCYFDISMEQRKIFFFADFHKITKEFCENQQKNYAKTSYPSKK
jgi:hypothetical protein